MHQADADVMKAILQLQWLIIDEISMVSASQGLSLPEVFFVTMASPTQRQEDEVETNDEPQRFLIAAQEVSSSDQKVAHLILKIESLPKKEVQETTPQVEASFPCLWTQQLKEMRSSCHGMKLRTN